jgi:monothiol glutaredoxin
MAEPELKQKVEELIRDHEVLLFMKGTPEQPQCGFSMRVVGVLDSMGVEYAALDVLPALNPLREATGEIADWRTFPQLYVKGDLVGGADIIEEMAESGELADLLDAPQPSSSDADSSASRPGSADAGLSAKQELQADTQQSPPMQIENS